jgi:hypothetical protein
MPLNPRNLPDSAFSVPTPREPRRGGTRTAEALGIATRFTERITGAHLSRTARIGAASGILALSMVVTAGTISLFPQGTAESRVCTKTPVCDLILTKLVSDEPPKDIRSNVRFYGTDRKIVTGIGSYKILTREDFGLPESDTRLSLAHTSRKACIEKVGAKCLKTETVSDIAVPIEFKAGRNFAKISKASGATITARTFEHTASNPPKGQANNKAACREDNRLILEEVRDSALSLSGGDIGILKEILSADNPYDTDVADETTPRIVLGNLETAKGLPQAPSLEYLGKMQIVDCK